jgi:pimeloyl-ACP methyl ester carboxylesterase
MAFEKLEDLHIGFETSRRPFIKNYPTLVMIHGAGGSAQNWRSQIHLLKDSLNTLALDLPGHGKTAGPGKASINEYARWLAEILHTLFKEPVFLMGHSLGGAVAQETALLYPKLLKGIILVATGPRLQVAPMFLEGLLNRFEQTVDTIMKYAYGPDADQSMVREGAKLMKTAGSTVVHSNFLACDQFDRRKDLFNIDIPCLIICGDKDRLSPPALSKSLNQLIVGSKLRILPSAGHMVMIESHKEFNKYVRDFIGRII